jgi:putative oxidoreductase
MQHYVQDRCRCTDPTYTDHSKEIPMEIGLLIVRVVVGALLVGHGSQKLFGWFGGYGLKGTGGYMESFGLRPGPLFALTAGAAELTGGLLFGTGLLTPVAAAMVASTMLVAARTDHAGKGLWIFNGGAEYVVTNAAVVIGVAFAGAGDWSLDHAIGWDVAGTWWGLAAAFVAVLGGGSVLAMRRLGVVAAGAAAA